MGDWRPNVLNEFTARGAAVRAGDFDDPRSLPPALAGGRRMLIISTTDLNRRVNQHQAAIDAAAAGGVEHVIYTSMIAPEPSNPAVIAPSHVATERHLAESRVSWTVLRHSLYAEYQMVHAARPPGLSSTTATPVPLPTCHALTARRWRWRS
jgi:NAD(P)H dehydrogenase (quinone)